MQSNDITSGRRMNLTENVLIWTFLMSFCFDFKGEEGGTFIQYVFAVISLISGGLFCLLPKLRPAQPGMKRICLFWGLYLASTVVMFMVYALLGTSDTPFDHYIRVAFPFYICGLSLLVTNTMARRNIRPDSILLPFVVAAIISSFWRVFYAVELQGLKVEGMRFQILSPLTTYMIAYGISGLFLERRPSLTSLLTLSVSVGFVMLSVTRVYLMTMLLCIIGAVYVMIVSRQIFSIKFLLRKALVLLMPLVFLLIALFMVIQVRPEFTKSWTDRIGLTAGGTKIDASLLMRIAASSGQWEEIQSDPLLLACGKGLGANYHWDDDYKGQIKSMSGAFYVSEPWVVSDSMIGYTIFSSGLLFGSMVFLFLLAGMRASFRIIRYRYRPDDPMLSRVAPFLFLGMVALLSQIVTSHPFLERMTAQMVGLNIGMIFWLAPSRQRASAPARTWQRQQILVPPVQETTS